MFPICGGRKIERLGSNIAALSIDLPGEDIHEIELATSFSVGCPHNLVSGSGNKAVSTKKPAFPVTMRRSFAGVDEPLAIRGRNE